jgi:uncharacterized protein (UPF0303 family)
MAEWLKLYRNLPSKHESLNSNPSTTKEEKRKKKTTLRFHLSSVRIAINKNTNNNKCW